MRIILFIMSAALLLSIDCAAQAPFVITKKPTKAAIVENQKTTGKTLTDTQQTKAVDEEREALEKPDFFDHANVNLNMLNNSGKLFPSINGEVVNYKLGIAMRKKKKGEGETEHVPVYLPFSVISKVSGNYMDPAAGATNDAVSFFGAPLTLRLSPSVDMTPEWTDNKLFFGCNVDLRMMIIGDTVANTLESGFGNYLSAGFTYMGFGFAESKNGTDAVGRHDGRWDFSMMFYWFKSGGNFNKAVFGNYEKKNLSGIEVLFRFKADKKEDSKFNFLIGASNGFTRGAPNFARWEFRLGVGS